MTPQQPMLSIVVAAYNVENTLDRIFEHVLACTSLDDLEVVVVNDGSKDSTLQLARQYEAKYPHLVQVVDKANGGHGSALSAGFRAAHGKFCRPLDGDDWLDPQGVDELVRFLSTTNVDMVICDHIKMNLDTNETKRIFSSLKPNTMLTVEDLVQSTPLPGYHDIVFATQVLHRIPELDHHCFYVDNEYDAYPLFWVNEIWYLPQTVYVHTVGNDEQSTSNASLIRNESNIRTVFFSLMDYCAAHRDHQAAVAVTQRYALGLLYLFTRVAFEMPPREGSAKLREFYASIQERYPEFYTQSMGQIPDICKRLGCHGYWLIRLMIHWRYRNNRSIVWQ